MRSSRPLNRYAASRRLSFIVGQEAMKLSDVSRWGIFVLGPFMVMALYLAMSRWPVAWFNAVTDHLAVAVSALIGLLALHTFDWNRPVKAYVAAVYIPGTTVAVLYFSFLFVCVVYERCL